MRFQHIPLLMSVAVLAAACDSTEPGSIAGTYEATSFVVTETGEAPVDVLAEGGGLTITIAADNSTTGTLTIPASLTGGTDINLSMTGTALRHGDVVHFEQTADSFVRDISWAIEGNNLVGVFTNAGVTVAITLTRQ
jgi:hypothetical protein